MTWTSPPASQPAWNFDGSLAGNGATAIWGDSNGLWDTGSNWNYPNYTGGTLSYQPAGLQLTGLSVTNVAGTAAPVGATNVVIAPPSSSSVSVTGPAGPVSIGALVIQGSNSATASLTLQGGDPLSPTSADVFAGGGLTADSDALNMPVGTLTVSQGSASLGSASTNVGAATVNSGVLSIGGGTIGILTASGGNVGVSGGTVTNAHVSGAAVVNATGGALTLLNASGGSTTVGSAATVGDATVNGNAVVNFNNTSTMTSLIASGGTTNVGGATVTVATVSGNAVVNVNSGSLPTLYVLGSNLTSGVTVGPGASAGVTALNVSGGLVTLNNSDTIPTAALSGGTTNLAAPTVTVANVSASALVNVTAGSVATLNVASSDLTHGVTVGPGASVGSTALNVSGGLVTLNNTNTIPTPAFSGGTTNLAGPTVTTANVSGTALVNVNAANSVSGATVINGGTVNVGDTAGLGLQQSTVTLNSNNSLTFGGTAATLGGLSGPGNLTLPSNVLKVGANNANTIYRGILTGVGGLTKVGTGTLQLTSSNAYSGPTLVNAGTLKLATGLAGFGGSGTGWTVNSTVNPSIPITNDVLTLTDNSTWAGTGPFETRSAWSNNKVSISSFIASFVYTAGGNKAADGVTFCLQNAAAGLGALGGGGGNLGYQSITPSAAVPFNIFPNTSQTGATLWTGGALGAYQTTGSVNIASGDPIQVTLNYNGTSLVENLLDLSNSATFSTTYAGVNLPTIVGGTLAYVGFTGAQGGSYATQTISNFNFSVASGSNILPTATALSVAASATFDLGGNNQTVASLSNGIGGGGTVLDSFAGLPSVLTVSPTGTTTTFSGSIVDGSGKVSLVLNGPGTQVLSGTNTYSGGTTVSDGTLIVTNSEALADGSSLTVGNASFFSAPVVPAPAAIAAVPEPSTLALAAAAGLAVAALGRKRLRRRHG